MSAYLKVEGGKECLKEDVGHEHEVGLSDDEMAEAEKAKEAAIEILEDALKKKDRLLMEEDEHDPMTPETAVSLEAQHGAMMRYAMVTPSEVEKLIAALQQIIFKKSTDPQRASVFAYVRPGDNDHTVYLCPQFRKSPEYLAKDSRPGTLIHEVSHFLGSKDITYAEKKIKVVMGGNFYDDGLPGNAALASPEKKSKNYALLKGNANSIEYEFEILLNHSKAWDDRKSCFPCCGERSRHSVCEESVPKMFAFFTEK